MIIKATPAEADVNTEEVTTTEAAEEAVEATGVVAAVEATEVVEDMIGTTEQRVGMGSKTSRKSQRMTEAQPRDYSETKADKPALEAAADLFLLPKTVEPTMARLVAHLEELALTQAAALQTT